MSYHFPSFQKHLQEQGGDLHSKHVCMTHALSISYVPLQNGT